MIRVLTTLSLLILVAVPAGATNYYVSSGGNDENTGLDSANAWESIDNGDGLGLLSPGDTITVYPGNYSLSTAAHFTVSGTAAQPIVYRRTGDYAAIFDMGGAAVSTFWIDADHLVFDGFALANSAHNGIYLSDDSCVITNCHAYGNGWDGIYIVGAGSRLIRNVMTDNSQSGIDVEASATYTSIYGNTLYHNNTNGVLLRTGVTTARVFNNIIVTNVTGIDGSSSNITAFNLLWDNTTADYDNGVTDSAGSLTVNPLFVAEASRDFHLQTGSPAVNAGLDMDYSYNGPAPDLGAFETSLGGAHFYVSPSGDDDNDGRDSANAWLSIDNGDQKGLLLPGDTVEVLPGTYVATATIQLTTNGTSDNPILYLSEGHWLTTVDGNAGAYDVLSVEGDNAIVSGLEITNSGENGIVLSADSVTIAACYVHDITGYGIMVDGSDNLLLRNSILRSGDNGLNNGTAGLNNLFYGNTVYGCSGNGLDIHSDVTTARAFNNLIVGNNAGIDAKPGNIIGFNDVWDNSGGNLSGGISDSAGGMSEDPLLVNPDHGNFHLRIGSPVIDAGLDLGYSFLDSAPEIGAVEYYVHSPVVYYVSVDGNDDNSGLDSANAWLSIDNGDNTGRLFPGDTVCVYPGTYQPTTSITLTTSGVAAQPVVYIGIGAEFPIIDGGTLGEPVIELPSDHVVLGNLTVTGGSDHGILVSGDSCILSGCRVDSTTADGVRVDGSYNHFFRNIITFTGDHGFHNRDGGVGNRYYGNTLYRCDKNAVELQNSVVTARIFNNIIVECDKGIDGNSSNKAAFNDVWNNGDDYAGGISDSAGGISEDPLFTDSATGDFSLQTGSPAIDAGLDLGYSYYSTAPDMGAVEFEGLISLVITTVLDTLKADTSYQFEVIGLDASGDTVATGDITWGHTFSSGSINATGLLTPDLVGTGVVFVQSDVSSLVDTSALITVIAGTVDSLGISPLTDTVSADSTRQFALTGYDGNGNLTSELGTVTWSVVGSIGAIDNTGLFDAGTVGWGFVHAESDAGPSVSSDTIFVIAGYPVTLDVTPDTNSVVENSSFQYTAYGYDADSNQIPNFTDSVTWSVTDINGGSVTAGGLYTAGNNVSPPNYYVKAIYDTIADSAVVEVVTDGTLDYIQIETADGTPLADTVLTTDNDTTSVFCRGYDSGDNLIGDLDAAWTLVTGDSVGTLTADSGTSTILILTGVGSTRLAATHVSSLTDTSGVILVTGGGSAYLVVSPPAATISADSSLQFTAETFDADSNLCPVQIIPIWEVVGTIGIIDSLSGIFTPSLAGNGSVAALGGGLADTAYPVTVTPGIATSMAITPDSAVVSADSTLQMQIMGYDTYGNETSAGTITWGLSESVGSIDSDGLFDATTVGNARVTALSDLGMVDTSAYLEVIPGELASLTVSPDTSTLVAGSTLAFTASGVDSDHNPTATGTLNWDVAGDIGTVDTGGLFTATTSGTGRISVTGNSGNVVDTNTYVAVIAADLDHLVIDPDVAAVGVGDSVQFTVNGYDVYDNTTAVGTLTWNILGRIGDIDATGLLIANRPGSGIVTATSSINSVRDSSGFIDVEELYASSIALGNSTVFPGSDNAALLAWNLKNYFSEAKTITAVTIRSVIRGMGNEIERHSNIDSIALYLDIDNDSLLTTADSALNRVAFTGSIADIPLTPLAVQPGSGLTLILAFETVLAARDGDTLDAFIYPSADITTGDGTIVAGPDSVNSLGQTVINGMIAAQISLAEAGAADISPGESMRIMTIDIPRNGYQRDTLKALSVTNTGTAADTDIDSLVLYLDDGDGTFNGIATETRLGRLAFTGSQWTLTGLSTILTDTTTRFHIVAILADYPTNGFTISLQIPADGIQVASGNDGPIDGPAGPTETFTIVTAEELIAGAIDVAVGSVIPGRSTGPMFGLRLTNTYATDLNLDSIRLNLLAIDPAGATRAQLDSQIDSILLYNDVSSETARSSAESQLLSVGRLADGVVTFATPGLIVSGNGGVLRLYTYARLSLTNARNGNSLSLQLASGNDVFTAESVPATGSMPLQNAEDFIIDAFPAEAIEVFPVEGSSFYGGQTNQLVFDCHLPGNGYAPDIIRGLRLQDMWANATDDALAAVKLWADDADNGFSDSDSQLGAFSLTNGYWVIDNLNYTLGPDGARFMVTVDIAATQVDGGNLQFQIPTAGVTYASGMTGPDDLPVSNPETHLVFPSNRVTAISIPARSTVIRPGDENVPLLTFALYNGYLDQQQLLQTVVLTNTGRTRSTMDFADDELGQVSVFFDVNRNRVLDESSPIATGYFDNGLLQMSGLATLLPPESLSYFFVVSDIPTIAIDSDSLAISISAASDLRFAEAVLINGDLPLTDGGYHIIDGSVHGQYLTQPLTPRTLSPGDTSVNLFRFRPAVNGDQTDILQSVTVRNRLTADTSDIATMELWLDRNGDGFWQAGDSLVGPFTYSVSEWVADGLDIQIAGQSPGLFVVADISPDATPNVEFQCELPIDGCQYASDNDGPIDQSVICPATFTVSSSGLRVSVSPIAGTFSVGQLIAVSFSTTNLQAWSVDSILGEIVSVANPGLVTLDSVVAGPVNLGSEEQTDFTFYYTAVGSGTETWYLRAVAPQVPDSSATVQTQTITIQDPPSSAIVQLINSIPTSVTRGQANVFPLTLRFVHPDTLLTAASLKLDSIRFHIETATGAAQNAHDVFSEMTLATAYPALWKLDSISADPSVIFDFSTPIIIAPGNSESFTMLVTIADDAAASDFVIAVESAAATRLTDHNSGIPVPVNPTITFPLRTASCRIDDPSRQVAVSSPAPLDKNVNYGQQNVSLLQLNLRHPGDLGTSQIQLTELSLRLVDLYGDSLYAAAVLDGIALAHGQSFIGGLTGAQLNTTGLTIPLTAPLTINAGESRIVDVLVTPSFESTCTSFKLVVSDSTRLTARDLSSGSIIDATTDTEVLATGSVFPVSSGWAVLKEPAVSPEICVSTMLPEATIGGVDSLALIELTLAYPVMATYSSIRLTEALISVLDSTGRPLDPDRLFDRIGYRDNLGVLHFQTAVELYGGAVRFRLSDTGILLDPGANMAIQLCADLEADAPYSHFLLLLHGGDALPATDATDTTVHLELEMVAGCTGDLPYTTAVTWILRPAGRPLLSTESLPVQMVFPGQGAVPCLAGQLAYENQTPQGDLTLQKVTARLLKRTATGLSPADAAGLFAAVHLTADDGTIAEITDPSGDSLVLTVPEGLAITTGTVVDLTVICDLKADAATGNYVIVLDDSSALDIIDANQLTAANPMLASGSFPLTGIELSVQQAGLEHSFTNYPNPFIPSRDEETTIGYVLDEDANIDVELFTITGEAIREIAMDLFQTEGAHQELTWSGDNDNGSEVAPGTYFCRITARYVSGREETFRRKIAVIR